MKGADSNGFTAPDMFLVQCVVSMYLLLACAVSQHYLTSVVIREIYVREATDTLVLGYGYFVYDTMSMTLSMTMAPFTLLLETTDIEFKAGEWCSLVVLLG